MNQKQEKSVKIKKKIFTSDSASKSSRKTTERSYLMRFIQLLLHRRSERGSVGRRNNFSRKRGFSIVSAVQSLLSSSYYFPRLFRYPVVFLFCSKSNNFLCDLQKSSFESLNSGCFSHQCCCNVLLQQLFFNLFDDSLCMFRIGYHCIKVITQ